MLVSINVVKKITLRKKGVMSVLSQLNIIQVSGLTKSVRTPEE